MLKLLWLSNRQSTFQFVRAFDIFPHLVIMFTISFEGDGGSQGDWILSEVSPGGFLWQRSFLPPHLGCFTFQGVPLVYPTVLQCLLFVLCPFCWIPCMFYRGRQKYVCCLWWPRKTLKLFLNPQIFQSDNLDCGEPAWQLVTSCLFIIALTRQQQRLL